MPYSTTNFIVRVYINPTHHHNESIAMTKIARAKSKRYFILAARQI